MTTLTKIVCNNFAGINRINSDFSSTQITASDLQNVELFNTGINSGVGIRSMKGNSELLSLGNPDEKIINIFQSVQNDEVFFFIHTETSLEGRIYRLIPDSSLLELKYSGLTPTGKSSGVDFAQGWSDLFIFSTGLELLSIQMGNYDTSGNSVEVQKLQPLDVDGRSVQGLGLTVFDGRLWVFDGVVLWYSVKENCLDFSTEDTEITTSAGYIEYPKKITAIFPYLGTLAVFHKDSSSLLSVNSDYSYSKTDDSVGGCASYKSLVFHGTELYFYDNIKKGVFCFSQVINGDKTLGTNLALDVQEEIFQIDNSKLDKIRTLSVVQSDKNEIWFLLPTNSDDYSLILIYDYINKQWLKRKSQKLVDINIIDDVFYSATESSVLYEYNGDDFNGEFIPSYYNCSTLNLKSDNSIKTLYSPPKLTLDRERQNDFVIKYEKNYDHLKSPKVKQIASKSLSNLFYWDKSSWDMEFVFKPKTVLSITKIPISTFKTLDISFSTTQLNQGFSIKNIEFQKIKVNNR